MSNPTLPQNLGGCFVVLCITAGGLENARAQAAANPVNKPGFRNAPTHADLAPAYERSKDEDPILRLGQNPEILAAAGAYSQASLLDRSQVLSYKGSMTLVPKGAILFVPDHSQDRLASVEGAQVVAWTEFFKINSQWILPLRVKLEQALGDEPLDPNLLARLAKSGKVVVATYFDHPISIHQKPAEEGGKAITK